LVALVARQYDALPAAQHARTTILAGNYGEAGAIDRYGPGDGLLQVYSGANNFWIWGPPPAADSAAIAGLARIPGVRVIRVRYGVMRPGVTGRPKPSREAEQQYEADLALASRRAELLDAAREAEARFREAQARHAPDAEVRRPAEDFDAALTAVMRAAYAAQRAEIGPRGYDDRIYRRKAKATPRVRALTAEAEHLLTLRETHRLTGIPAVAFEPAP
jgi:hypothetical protein